MANEQLSTDEVWDDTALLTSWDEAVAEYKKYHSLAAKGEKIKAAEIVNDDDNVAGAGIESDAQVVDPSTQDQQVGEEATTVDDGDVGRLTTSRQAVPGAHLDGQGVVPGMAVPSGLLNTVQDESLKNLMMSWYYAGYYTGLYEGQQKAYASMQQDG